MEEAKEMTLEEELEWCTNQLLLGLATGTSNPEQVQESKKVILKLNSDKLPLVAKRQLMNVVFGDYRRTMKQIPLQKTRDELARYNIQQICTRYNIKLKK